MYDGGGGVGDQYCRVSRHVAHFPPQANQKQIHMWNNSYGKLK